jgi:hypothetical protein
MFWLDHSPFIVPFETTHILLKEIFKEKRPSMTRKFAYTLASKRHKSRLSNKTIVIREASMRKAKINCVDYFIIKGLSNS